ncbi:MAG TPA: alpha/beta hydrolase [Bryobacteraceae bacterium]|nr:alpha/beta hydrolase [Bryobacteraceae bacterium]
MHRIIAKLTPSNFCVTARSIDIAASLRLISAGLWLALFLPLSHGQHPQKSETGYVTTAGGVHLSYTKIGTGSNTVIAPLREFLLPDFQGLAKGRTIIFYDPRNRGRSDAVSDLSQIGLQHDVDDLEAVRAHFAIDKPDLIGFSYMGKIVILYGIQHPKHLKRIIQLSPVARKLGTKYPVALTAGDDDTVPDPEEVKKMDSLYASGFAKEHPREYCEMEWKVEQQRLVGSPSNASHVPSPCDMENEWPVHLWVHFGPLMASDQALDIPTESIANVKVPVLTIHGTKDRNAPYGGGREWDLLLPNARLITIKGAAHASWIEFPEIVFPNIDRFLNGRWPAMAKPVKNLEPLVRRKP